MLYPIHPLIDRLIAKWIDWFDSFLYTSNNNRSWSSLSSGMIPFIFSPSMSSLYWPVLFDNFSCSPVFVKSTISSSARLCCKMNSMKWRKSSINSRYFCFQRTLVLLQNREHNQSNFIAWMGHGRHVLTRLKCVTNFIDSRIICCAENLHWNYFIHISRLISEWPMQSRAQIDSNKSDSIEWSRYLWWIDSRLPNP